MKFAIIGAGVVGTALAVRLKQAGYECPGVSTRSIASYRRFHQYVNVKQLPLEELIPQVDLVFFTTQDDRISTIAKEIAVRKLYRQGQAWIHCSGALSSEVLRAREELPVFCLSIHPLQAFADVDCAIRLIPGTHFGVEGEDVALGEKIVRDLGGIPHLLRTENKALYHAGAVMASNYLVVLSALAVEMFVEAGMEESEALSSLLPLMNGTLQNLAHIGLPEALTGPIARGDVSVVKKHLQSMSPRLATIYRVLGKETLKLGLAKKELDGNQYTAKTYLALQKILSTPVHDGCARESKAMWKRKKRTGERMKNFETDSVY